MAYTITSETAQQVALTDKQQKRYDRVLDMAAKLMYDQGFYKLSLTDLTNKLRVSRSTIYENFGSKEGLVAQVVDKFGRQLDEGLNDIVQDNSLGVYEKFIAVSKQLAANSTSRNIHHFYDDLKIHTPALYEAYLESRKRRIKNIYEPLIQEGFEQGLFDVQLKPDFLLQTYLKSIQVVCQSDMLEQSSISKSEALETITRIFLNGSKKLFP